MERTHASHVIETAGENRDFNWFSKTDKRRRGPVHTMDIWQIKDVPGQPWSVANAYANKNGFPVGICVTFMPGTLGCKKETIHSNPGSSLTA